MARTPLVPIEQLVMLVPPRERDLVRSCLQYLAICQVRAWRTNVVGKLIAMDGRGRRRAIEGLPVGHADIAGVLAPIGRAVYVETKVPGRRLTSEQAAWQEAMKQCGALVLTVHSLEELRQGLRAAGVPAP
jgi:hypothetical protein